MPPKRPSPLASPAHRRASAHGPRRARLVAVGADRLEHVRDVRQAGVGGGEGRHDLASVRRDAKGVEAGDLQALGGGDEAEDANHREAAVVQLDNEATLLLLGRELLLEAEGVEQVEGDRVRELVRELGEVARLAATHVVLLAIHLEGRGGLGPHLQEADEAQDLELGRRGERVPLVSRAARRRDVSVAHGRDVRHGGAERALDVAREVDAVRLDAVADERGHRNAAVLDLGLPEPGDRLLGGVADAERVPVADDRVGLLGESLEAGLVGDLRRGPRLGVERDLEQFFQFA